MVLPRLHDAALGKKVQRRADRRTRDADEISELLLAQMMARLQPGVSDDVQKLIGQVEAALTGGKRHGWRGFRRFAKKVQYVVIRTILSWLDPCKNNDAEALSTRFLPIMLDEAGGKDCTL